MMKLAVIGASELQNPLILKAQQMGIETHVFAWEAGDVGETTADFFYPISITERDEITQRCRAIGVNGVCTIASDLGNATAGYVAHALGLPCNSPECVLKSTNKQAMRASFVANGDPSPKSMAVHPGENVDLSGFTFPIIVKPVDRSGSRGVTKLASAQGLEEALQTAFACGFQQTALVEEFAEGDEYSFEYCSHNGTHTLLAATQKFTTGAPHFIERGHVEPADLAPDLLASADAALSHALDGFGVTMGASHAEMKIDRDGRMNIIEIGTRMGGDCIGSDLVQLTCGVDYVAAVIDCALGRTPDLQPHPAHAFACVKYLFDQNDLDVLERVRAEHPEWLVRVSHIDTMDHDINDSSSRLGFFVMAMDSAPDTSYLNL